MILDNWQEMSGKFVKVMPIDYRKALDRLREREAGQERRRRDHGGGVSLRVAAFGDRTDPADPSDSDRD